MFAYNNSRSVSRLKLSWQMIETRRFHMFTSVLQARMRGRICFGCLRSRSPANPAISST